MMSRREGRISRHLTKQLPRLLRLAKAPLPETTLWESAALMCLRAAVRPGSGNFIQQEVLRLLGDLQAAIPSLMSLQIAAVPQFDPLLETWRQENACRSSTQTPTPDSKEEDEDVCPVCLAMPPVQETSCGHHFCATCLNICARARPYEPLTCPLCREHLRPALHSNTPEPSIPPGFYGPSSLQTPPSSTYFSGGRPRVNEDWLTEDEIATYLGYYVPILTTHEDH